MRREPDNACLWASWETKEAGGWDVQTPSLHVWPSRQAGAQGVAGGEGTQAQRKRRRKKGERCMTSSVEGLGKGEEGGFKGAFGRDLAWGVEEVEGIEVEGSEETGEGVFFKLACKGERIAVKGSEAFAAAVCLGQSVYFAFRDAGFDGPENVSGLVAREEGQPQKEGAGGLAFGEKEANGTLSAQSDPVNREEGGRREKVFFYRIIVLQGRSCKRDGICERRGHRGLHEDGGVGRFGSGQTGLWLTLDALRSRWEEARQLLHASRRKRSPLPTRTPTPCACRPPL